MRWVRRGGMWHDGYHSFLWVWAWVSASQRIPSSRLVRNPHKGLACEISYETGRRRGKARSPGSQQKRGVSDSLERAIVRERQQLKEELGLVDPEAGLASARVWVSVPGSCVGISFEYTLVTATECQKSAKTSPFLRLGQPKSVLVYSSFFHSRLYMLCLLFICKAYEMPPAGDERGHWMIGWSWAGSEGWDCGDRPCRAYCPKSLAFPQHIKSWLIKFIERIDIFPLEQNGYKKESFDCNVQLPLKSMIIENSRSKLKNLSMACIDIKKSYGRKDQLLIKLRIMKNSRSQRKNLCMTLINHKKKSSW